MRGLWKVTYAHPERTNTTWNYLIPVWDARTENAARERAQARHDGNVAHMPARIRAVEASELEVLAVVFRPAVLSRERAVAWIALQQHGAITEQGWPLAQEGQERGRDEWWRGDVGELHMNLRERIHGFGVSVAEILQVPDTAASAAWAVEAHTDRFGRVWWDRVRAEIHKAGLSWLWQTPYGMAWIDQA
ncbi:hypothetical protein [Streptomyces alanosinicus]|uniref:Uncharacterized protein n=1 Tax=Streptomyces alanosinicus TaxID=68171 RepID=A0A919D6M7_9ACTN|nr:hypothetical protein [Streptomyces alanosinicus]GHE09215.1 hypothetical protein GCM10010339_60730 [Streptomyces alanosinicus]